MDFRAYLGEYTGAQILTKGIAEMPYLVMVVLTQKSFQRIILGFIMEGH